MTGLSAVSRARAHPRSRGENLKCGCFAVAVLGSSPLTRGKRQSDNVRRARGRLIPAHAGKTPLACADPRRSAAHPRSRGENVTGVPGGRRPPGSSPLTRGKQDPRAVVADIAGLIPAHAGKTFPSMRTATLRTAHPRSRGENLTGGESAGATFGSSPLTRGKHFLTCAFTAQIDQILETLELAASFGSYLIWVACATDAPQDPVRSIGLVLPSSRGAS